MEALSLGFIDPPLAAADRSPPLDPWWPWRVAGTAAKSNLGNAGRKTTLAANDSMEQEPIKPKKLPPRTALSAPPSPPVHVTREADKTNPWDWLIALGIVGSASLGIIIGSPLLLIITFCALCVCLCRKPKIPPPRPTTLPAPPITGHVTPSASKARRTCQIVYKVVVWTAQLAFFGTIALVFFGEQIEGTLNKIPIAEIIKHLRYDATLPLLLFIALQFKLSTKKALLIASALLVALVAYDTLKEEPRNSQNIHIR